MTCICRRHQLHTNISNEIRGNMLLYGVLGLRLWSCFTSGSVLSIELRVLDVLLPVDGITRDHQAALCNGHGGYVCGM